MPDRYIIFDPSGDLQQQMLLNGVDHEIRKTCRPAGQYSEWLSIQNESIVFYVEFLIAGITSQALSAKQQQ